MKTKKLLSLLLSITMLLSLLSVPAASAQEESTVTAYLSVSRHGAFVTTNEGSPLALSPVTLTGQESYTFDDLFVTAHDLYFDGSADKGYLSADIGYGSPSIVKFWGEETQNVGYQINGGINFAMGLSQPVTDGDIVDVTLYQSLSSDTEYYAKFDAYEKSVSVNDPVTLCLTAGTEYDASWNYVFTPISDAIMTVNGVATDILTDANGNATLTFRHPGTYIVSANKTKQASNETVTAITAPVCRVTVTEPAYLTAVHNITGAYLESGILSDGNLHWLAADLAVYNSLYPDRATALSGMTQDILDTIIEEADNATAPNVLAKNILALRALGYDATKVYNKYGTECNIAEKLTKLVDAQSPDVTNIYTLPYVIIALRQSEIYATKEQLSYLIDTALQTKDLWQSTQRGTDGLSPMVLALAPYYEKNDAVKTVLDEAIQILYDAQADTGLIGNACSTGLAICAFTALDIDPTQVTKNDVSLIDGLMTQATENLSAFYPTENTFATEQGLRGLLAYCMLTEKKGKSMYDFSALLHNEAHATKQPIYHGGGGGGGATYYTVTFETNGGSDMKKKRVKQNTVLEMPAAPVKEGHHLLGYYTDEMLTVPYDFSQKVTASFTLYCAWEQDAPRLSNKHDDVTFCEIKFENKSFSDISNHENEAAILALAQRGIINGRTETEFVPDGTITRAEFAALIVRALGLPAQKATAFSDVLEHAWFFSAVSTAKHYGIVNGVSETAFLPDGTITRQEAATMVKRAAILCGMDTELTENGVQNVLAAFPDYTTASDWAKPSLAFCYANGILDDSVLNIQPFSPATRGEIAQMLYNLLHKSELLQR